MLCTASSRGFAVFTTGLSTVCPLCRCFGRLAGAFRVYVEEEEGQLWGWYEGEQGGDLRAARPELGSALS